MQANTIISIIRSSLSGLFKSSLSKVLVAVCLFFPLFIFLTHEMQETQNACLTFWAYQYGFQKWFLLITSLSLLHLLIGDDLNIGTQSALRAAGVQPLEYLLGKLVTITVCLFSLAIFICLYSALLGIFIPCENEIYGSFWVNLSAGLLYALASLILSTFAYLIWTFSLQQTLSFLITVVCAMISFTKPFWITYLINPDQNLFIKCVGYLIKFIIPSFHRFDLWIAMQLSEKLNIWLHFLESFIFGEAILLIILIALWRLAVIKKD